MSYTRKQLEAKSDLELASVAKAEFQIVFDVDVTPKALMVDAILEAQTAGQKAPTEAVIEPPKKRFRVVIHNQEGVDNTPFVPVGVNGFVYQIPREVEVQVPQEVVTILTQAEQTVPETDDKGRVVGYKTVKRFPFSVLGEAA